MSFLLHHMYSRFRNPATCTQDSMILLIRCSSPQPPFSIFFLRGSSLLCWALADNFDCFLWSCASTSTPWVNEFVLGGWRPSMDCICAASGPSSHGAMLNRSMKRRRPFRSLSLFFFCFSCVDVDKRIFILQTWIYPN